MTKTFNTVPYLDQIGGALSIAVMAGLTLASAATYAVGSDRPAATVVQLPAVVVTVKRATPIAQLPSVIVVAKRAGANPSA